MSGRCLCVYMNMHIHADMCNVETMEETQTISSGQGRGRMSGEGTDFHCPLGAGCTVTMCTLVLASMEAQTVKNLPTMQKMWVRSLGWEDPLEKETATHSSIPAWGSPWTEEPGGLQSMGSQRVGHERISNTHVQVLTGPIPTPSNKLMKRNIQVLSKEN